MTVEEASAKIVSLSEEMGYLNDSNNQVKITVISDDAKVTEILKSAVKSGVQKGSKKAVVAEETRLQDEVTLKKLKEEQPQKFAELTEEKVRLIESVMEYDSSMTYETGAEMSVKELSEALKNAIKENKDVFTSQLRSQYSELYTAKKQEIEREIAAVYGEEYLSEWEKVTAFENLYNSIVTAIDKTGLSEEDIDAVMELLGVSDVSLIEKGGIVKPEYVLNYIDKHKNKKSAQAERDAINAVKEILSAYDAKNYALSEETIADFAEVTGTNVAFTVLSDVAKYLSELKSELNGLKNTVILNEEQIEQIRVLKESFSAIKESVIEEMQVSINDAREKIIAEKQERSNH